MKMSFHLMLVINISIIICEANGRPKEFWNHRPTETTGIEKMKDRIFQRLLKEEIKKLIFKMIKTNNKKMYNLRRRPMENQQTTSSSTSCLFHDCHRASVLESLLPNTKPSNFLPLIKPPKYLNYSQGFLFPRPDHEKTQVVTKNREDFEDIRILNLKESDQIRKNILSELFKKLKSIKIQLEEI